MSDLSLILLTALLAAISCSFVGLHLILRRQAMLSDALSHSALPGLVLVYIFFRELHPLALLGGALMVSIVMTFSLEWIRQQKLLREDAAMGLVFSSLFALGVLLLENFASSIHLDTSCLLYGELAFVPLENTRRFLGIALPESTYLILWISILLLTLGFLFHKELLIAAFHEEMAQSMGIPIKMIQFLLMLTVSIVIMACFRSLGAILVIAFLILPGAFGSLYCRSFRGIYSLGLAYSGISIAIGTYLAFSFNNNVGAMTVSVAFIVFILCYSIQRVLMRNPRRRVH